MGCPSDRLRMRVVTSSRGEPRNPDRSTRSSSRPCSRSASAGIELVAYAIRRELNGTNVEVEMRGTRYEPAHPERWWAYRDDLRWVLDEGAKLIAYELGLGA